MKNEPLCRAPCPIARSLGRIGDSWSIMILRDAFAGFTRFDEFQKSSNVAPNILSRRLKELVDDGLLEKVCYSSTPPRYEYHLTPRGRDFRMVLLALSPAARSASDTASFSSNRQATAVRRAPR